MGKETPAEMARKIKENMDETLRQGAPAMLPVTLGYAVMRLLETGVPVTNQSIRDYFSDALAKSPASPLLDYLMEAVVLLDRSAPEQ